jgi:hypothetical protein
VIAQSHFMVVAPVAQGRVDELRALLATMTDKPGRAVPHNSLVPFARIGTLHMARFVILIDRTPPDLAQAYGIDPSAYTPSLAFLGECDGPARPTLSELAAVAEDGLKLIFSHCAGFDPSGDLLRWMRRHSVRAAAAYTNWPGRTLTQIRDEAKLHRLLRAALGSGSAPVDASARGLHSWLRQVAAAESPPLTPVGRWPSGYILRERLHAAGALLLLLLASPLLLLLAPFVLAQIRRQERTDVHMVQRPDPAHVRELAAREDHDVTNQFSVFGSAKPGRLRRWTWVAVLWLINLAARHLYTRGRLARISTIHFARWVFLNRGRQVYFASNYDGSLEAYMDDFINKAGFGLNLAFWNGVGYPPTHWVVHGGAAHEQPFKHALRGQQLPTEVWYKAYPGLTLADLERNARLRAGLEAEKMTEAEARGWLALI